MKPLFVRIATLALGFVFVSSPALAQAKKKAEAKKGAAAAPEKKESLADKKAAERKKEERRGPAALKDLPRLEDAEKDALADKKRDEAIDSLKKIIPKIEDGSPQKAELLFQLSEMYWEKSKYLYVKEMKKFQEDEKKIDAARNKGEKVADAKEDHRESELYRSETMRLYETILREYPAYDRKDEVLFSLGYNQYEIGKRDQAVKRYEELIKNYPGSKFVPDTYVQLGNHYFDVAANLSKAKEMYEKAYASAVPKIKSYALYKLAWVDYNAGEHEKALKKLQDVIDYAEKQGKAFTDLKNEALNDSVLMFVQLNRADDGVAYYKAHAGKKKQVTLTTRLAYGLADAGHHDNAIKIFRQLLNDSPVAESAPDIQQAIIKSYEGLRQRDNVKAETKKMAELYRPGSTWWKANESKKEVLRNGFAVAEEAMRTVVTDYHQEAQKTKQVGTYRLARDIYKQYVDGFAAGDDENYISDQAFNLKFYYAEILWALEEFEPAAKQYDEVAAFKVPNRDEAKAASNEKYRQTASYNAILAWTKLINLERGLIQKVDLKDSDKLDENKKKESIPKAQQKLTKRTAEQMAEKPLTKYENAFIAAADAYNKRYPKNQDEIELGYASAVIYYEKNHAVEAARRFGDIILKYPEDKRASDAADFSMASLEEKEEWLELNKLSRAFSANNKIAKPGTEFTKRLHGIVEGSQYKYDELVYFKDKDYKKAAELFTAFVAEFPKSENADRALVYVTRITIDANEFDKSIEVCNRFLKEYPTSIFDLEVKRRLATLYQNTADFEKSALAWEDFIASYDEAMGPKAIGYENIKELLKKEKEQKEKDAKAAKKDPKAAKVAAAPAKAAKPAKPDPKNEKLREEVVKDAEKSIADAQFNAALWWEGLGKTDKAISAWTKYMTRFKDKEDVAKIAFNLGLIYEKEKKPADALKAYDTFLTAYAKDKRATDLQRLEAKYRQYLLQKQLKNTAEMDKLAKDIVATYLKLSTEADKKNDRALQAVAHTRFYLLEPMWKAYTDIKFNKIATLKNDLAAKTKKIVEVEKAYTEVLQIGNGEYGIAALTRIGLAYGDLSQNFLDSPDPKGLDEDQLAMYRSELENRAFPLEEKAIEGLELALKKSYELNIYNEWTLLAQDKINKYRPGLYAKVREIPYKGAEFFVTAAFEKKAGDLKADPTPSPAPSTLPPDTNKPSESKEAAQPKAPTSASAPSPGAGSR